MDEVSESSRAGEPNYLAFSNPDVIKLHRFEQHLVVDKSDKPPKAKQHLRSDSASKCRMVNFETNLPEYIF